MSDSDQKPRLSTTEIVMGAVILALLAVLIIVVGAAV